jgi:hypothetical protein
MMWSARTEIDALNISEVAIDLPTAEVFVTFLSASPQLLLLIP